MFLFKHASSSHRRIICPGARLVYYKYPEVITVNGQNHHIINTSHLVTDAKSEEFNDFHILLRRDKKLDDDDDIHCWACEEKITDVSYCYCKCCCNSFHKGCTESPPVFHSSDHPKHPLQLLWVDLFLHQRKCHSCGPNSGKFFYYCSICDFVIHPSCAQNPTPLTIDNKKRHKHSLHYFPRRSALICDVCGLENGADCLYVCLLCDFIVHKRCVHLPNVIKVSRHDHRLAFTPDNTPYKELTNCGVCHEKINENYGKYVCMKGCVYAMHSRCAMRKDVSDGKELEGEPEEAYENIKMFEEEGDGIIRHLSHPGHQMQLQRNIQRAYDDDDDDDENKHCQACTLPFYDDGNVYQCVQCDFMLHESCAELPRVKQFMIHVHPLILKTGYIRWFICRKCNRYSRGFRYVCPVQGCDLVLDTLCASICEPYSYHSHPDPLFITYNEDTMKECSICRSEVRQPLNCVKCDFVLCFHCATLPHKARYEHDAHFLTFSYQKDVSDEGFWCEICEKDINSRNGLYACNECGVMVHIKCLLGGDPYIKIGKIDNGYETIDVIPNTSSTKPICKGCRTRCPYKTKIVSPRFGVFGSLHCFIYHARP